MPNMIILNIIAKDLVYSCKLAIICIGIITSEHSDNLTGKFIFSYNNGRLIYYYKKDWSYMYMDLNDNIKS